MSLPEVQDAVERLGCELDDIRRKAEERQAAAQSDLEAETPVLQTQVRAINERIKELQEKIGACRRERNAVFERQTEIEEAFDASVQHMRKTSALPNTQTLLDFMNGGKPVSSNRVSPMSPSSAGFFLDPRVEAGHADELALVAEEHSPYYLALPASISILLAKRRAEDAPETLGKRLRSVPSAMELVEKTIRFDELFNDRNARYKHRIVQYNEGWFILRCDEHDMHFPYRAALAAGSYLKAYAHNGPSAALPAVIEAFGIRVLGCDKEKAELNNERF
ncbi:hypothetical protein CCUS01_16412 [Colletotrichum cuscutae]|uniref:Uncharacterized protein n=1 Tax=Colletotrichum cuscutae TaxID=1209917 RepID=A0AAI9VD96_9PEZI|nr:hypothetical protein CCUS01_16412 [Colletotrichum cuscutae]